MTKILEGNKLQKVLKYSSGQTTAAIKLGHILVCKRTYFYNTHHFTNNDRELEGRERRSGKGA